MLNGRKSGWFALVPLLTLVACSGPPGATDTAEADPEALLALHRTVIEAHKQGDVDAWLAVESADYLSANAGEITFPDKAQRRSRREPYLGSTTFDRYEDLVPPIKRDGRWLMTGNVSNMKP